jgi:predicted permease
MTRHFSRLRAALDRWIGGRSSRQQKDAELQSFLEHDIDARIEAGMAPAEARRTALASFGGVSQVHEQVDDARTGASFEQLVRDARYAGRAARRSAGLSLAIIGSLALGIAAMVTAVAFINGAAFGKFPGVADQDRLVTVELRRLPAGRPPGNLLMSAVDYDALRAGLAGMLDVTTTSVAGVTAALPEPRQLNGVFVSANYFDVLGARPALGRAFHTEEDQPAHAAVAVISYNVWQRQFGADRAVIGRTIRVADAPVEIIGVAAPAFGGTNVRLGAEGPDIWLPLALAVHAAPDSTAMPGRDRRLTFIGRLQDGRTIEQVTAAARSVAGARIDAEGFASTHQPSAVVRPVSMFDPSFRAQALTLVLPIPIIVLVIACVNAANLMLARGSRQRREVAIRLAIGAGRARVARQLLLESLVLSLAATAVALPLAWSALSIVSARLMVPMPIDTTVLVWTLFVTIASTIVFGLMPAVRVTAHAPFQALSVSRVQTDGTPAESRGRRALVIAQVALSIGVLTVASQLVTLIESDGGAAGTRPDRLLMASFDLDQLKLSPDAAAEFYRRLVDASSTMPGIESAGLARQTAVWTFGRGKGPGSLVVWQPGQALRDAEVVVGGYAGGELFRALGLDVVEGRAFQPADRIGPPRVAIVNGVYARQMPGGRAVGQTVRVLGHSQWDRRSSAEGFAAGREVEIVGVIESASEPRYTRDGTPVSKIYLPSPLQPEPALTLYARTRADAASVAPALRALVSAIDPRVPVLSAGSLAAFNERSMGPSLWLTRTAAVMGVVALLLAAMGLFAVASYVAAQRSREFAIRLALGARPRGVLGLVLRQSMRLVTAGFVIGGAIALGVTQLFRTQFHGADGLDYGAFAGTTSLLAIVMLIASVVPAGRAARTNPVESLKES